MNAYVQLEVTLYGHGLRVLCTGTYLGKSRTAMDLRSRLPRLLNSSVPFSPNSIRTPWPTW